MNNEGRRANVVVRFRLTLLEQENLKKRSLRRERENVDLLRKGFFVEGEVVE